MIIPRRLAESCSKAPERTAWLNELPSVLSELERRWSLTLGPPVDHDEVSCSWVVPATCADGTTAMLKLGMPHYEGAHEIDGLRFWDGNPTVRLLRTDDSLNAMLLERCDPGTPLRELDEPEQDVVVAGLLRRLWREPGASHPFRPLAEQMDLWCAETLSQSADWPDPGLVREGLLAVEQMLRTTGATVLLATDLHAGNVLHAQREPWLVIDPKPFVGDPAYDATQHLLNCKERMLSDPDGTIARFADLLEIERERIRLWTFARFAAEPRDDWNDELLFLARGLAP